MDYFRSNVNINCPTSNEISVARIDICDLNYIRTIEDKLKYLIKLEPIILDISYTTCNPNYLSEVFILEGNYIAEFKEKSRDMFGDQKLFENHVYRLSEDDISLLNMLDCRDSITQDELKQLTLKSTLIL